MSNSHDTVSANEGFSGSMKRTNQRSKRVREITSLGNGDTSQSPDTDKSLHLRSRRRLTGSNTEKPRSSSNNEETTSENAVRTSEHPTSRTRANAITNQATTGEQPRSDNTPGPIRESDDGSVNETAEQESPQTIAMAVSEHVQVRDTSAAARTARARAARKVKRMVRIGMGRKRRKNNVHSDDDESTIQPMSIDTHHTQVPVDSTSHDAHNTTANEGTTPTPPINTDINTDTRTTASPTVRKVMSSPMRRKIQAARNMARRNAVLKRNALNVGTLKPLPRRFHQQSHWPQLSLVTPDPAGILYRPRIQGKREPLWTTTLGAVSKRKPPIWRVCQAPAKNIQNSKQ